VLIVCCAVRPLNVTGVSRDAILPRVVIVTSLRMRRSLSCRRLCRGFSSDGGRCSLRSARPARRTATGRPPRDPGHARTRRHCAAVWCRHCAGNRYYFRYALRPITVIHLRLTDVLVPRCADCCLAWSRCHFGV